MGINASIYVQCSKAKRHSYVLRPIKDGCEWVPNGATHEYLGEYDNYCEGRLWTPNYRRGNFANHAAIILRLLCTPNVRRVWYSGDENQHHLMSFPKLRQWLKLYLKEADE